MRVIHETVIYYANFLILAYTRIICRDGAKRKSEIEQRMHKGAEVLKKKMVYTSTQKLFVCRVIFYCVSQIRNSDKIELTIFHLNYN